MTVIPSCLALRQSSSGREYLAARISYAAIQPYLELLRERVGQRAYDDYLERKFRRDGDEFHVTVVRPTETENLPRDLLLSCQDRAVSFNCLGLGQVSQTDNEAFYVVVDSPEVLALRDQLCLPGHDLHITIGFKQTDIHDVPKDHTSIIACHLAGISANE